MTEKEKIKRVLFEIKKRINDLHTVYYELLENRDSTRAAHTDGQIDGMNEAYYLMRDALMD